MTPLVLSLFPGIGLLDMAFEAEGFCVVRGPDILWGGDIHKFHPPAGKFDGVIGGPPCQCFSRLRHIVEANGYQTAPNLIPEFERVVSEAAPSWFVMENVEAAPEPSVLGYIVRAELLRDVWVGGETNRLRRFCFGTRDGRELRIETLALHRVDPEHSALASGGGQTRTRSHRRQRQGQAKREVRAQELRLQDSRRIRESQAPARLACRLRPSPVHDFREGQGRG